MVKLHILNEIILFSYLEIKKQYTKVFIIYLLTKAKNNDLYQIIIKTA